MEVHRVLGNGFLEPIYQEAMAIELAERDIPFVREEALTVGYKGRSLSCAYRVDFVCFGDVIVELKALKQLSSNEESQVINYLKASGIEKGLLLNFGYTSLQHRRLIRSSSSPRHPF